MPAPLKSPPRTSDETRALYEEEIVKSKVDKDKLRFLSDLLQSQERSEERAEKSAVSLLATITAERDTLAARVAELEPIAARVVELETFKATNDEWRAEQVRALTEEATKKLWAAERFRNEAKNISEEAHLEVRQSGITVVARLCSETHRAVLHPRARPDRASERHQFADLDLLGLYAYPSDTHARLCQDLS